MAKNYSSLIEIKGGLQSGEVTVEKLVKHYLENIKANAHLNAFNEVFSEEALNRAKNIDARVQLGNAGRLAGMVIGIKDNICYKDHKVSASSKILDGFTSIYSSTIVERALTIMRIGSVSHAIGSLLCITRLIAANMRGRAQPQRDRYALRSEWIRILFLWAAFFD